MIEQTYKMRSLFIFEKDFKIQYMCVRTYTSLK